MRFTVAAACEFIHKLVPNAPAHRRVLRAAPAVAGRTVIFGAMPVHVTSEIGRLRWRPRPLARARAARRHPEQRATTTSTTTSSTPSGAQREHRRFIAILERFCQVYEVRDLLADMLANAEARELLIRETMDIVPSRAARPRHQRARRRRARTHAHRGREEPPGPLAQALNESGYVLPPLPNLFFTRDSCMVVGEHVLVGSMRYAIRWTGSDHHEGAVHPPPAARATPASCTTAPSERRRELHARGRRRPPAAARPRRDRLQRALEPGGDRSARDAASSSRRRSRTSSSS